MAKLPPNIECITDWHGILLLNFKYQPLQDGEVFEDSMRLLTLEQRSQVLKKKSYSDKYKVLCNRLLQNAGISMAIGIPIDHLNFYNGMYGKPRIKDENGVMFNMSYGRLYIGQYISKMKDNSVCQEVGIDLASILDYREDDEDLENFRQIFSPQEFECLIQYHRPTERAHMFAYIWSLKECFTKFTGLGLNSNLRSIDFGKLDLFEHDIILRKRIDHKEMWFYSCWITPDEVVTVCHELNCILDGIPPIYHLKLQDVLNQLQETDK